MGHTDKLAGILKPLGIYKLDSGAGAAELHAIGTALDRAEDGILEAELECVVQTAGDWGLSLYESILPRIPAYYDIDTRRAAVMALLQLNESSFTVNGINSALSGCGISASAAESDKAQTVTVTFPDVRGVPNGIEKMKTIIEDIIPCHLDIEYIYVFLKWFELEKIFPTWVDIEGKTWAELEVSG